MRILFIGNHTIGVKCLEYLIASPHEVVGVVGMPEDPEEPQYYASVVELAKRHGIHTLTPKNINAPEVVAALAALKPDLIPVVSYRQILAKSIIQLPSKGIFNYHSALLPKYRGGSPINWAIIKGETETGVTLHHIDEAIDHGPIIAQRRVPIAMDDTAVTVLKKLDDTGFAVFKEVIAAFERGDVPRQPNKVEEGSIYRRRTPEQGLIDWHQDAVAIYNFIRALVYPYPGAFTFVGEKKLIIWWGTPMAIKPLEVPPGQVFRLQHSAQWAIAAQTGAILLHEGEVVHGNRRKTFRYSLTEGSDLHGSRDASSKESLPPFLLNE